MNSYEALLIKAQAKVEMLQARRKQSQQAFEKAASRLQYIEAAQALLQKVAQDTQMQLTFQIEDVVNTALDTCFPGEYKFHISFEIQRNKTEAKLVFTKNDYEIDPLKASGGGVVDVAAFALRIAAWTIGTSNNTLIIDEGFRFLSRNLQPRAAEIMQEISEKLHVQFIQVSHSPDIIAQSDRVFTVALKKGVSQVTYEA